MFQGLVHIQFFHKCYNLLYTQYTFSLIALPNENVNKLLHVVDLYRTLGNAN